MIHGSIANLSPHKPSGYQTITWKNKNYRVLLCAWNKIENVRIQYLVLDYLFPIREVQIAYTNSLQKVRIYIRPVKYSPTYFLTPQRHVTFGTPRFWQKPIFQCFSMYAKLPELHDIQKLQNVFTTWCPSEWPQHVGAPRGRKMPAGGSPAREIIGSSR
jgi:hypothetical protein